MLKAMYDGYTTFGAQFGHMSYNEPFSDYYLVIEYRFTGDWLADTPSRPTRRARAAA